MSFGFEPVVVFDGCLSEGTRKGTAANRKKKRREHYEKYVASLNGGKVDDYDAQSTNIQTNPV